MEKKPITYAEIWQNKPERYAYLSLVVLMILVVVAPFFPRLWPLWIALALLGGTVFAILTWIITAREQKEA
jgi:uncharacterized membrane protein YdjX (TVP38/TMEM64 family)